MGFLADGADNPISNPSALSRNRSLVSQHRLRAACRPDVKTRRAHSSPPRNGTAGALPPILRRFILILLRRSNAVGGRGTRLNPNVRVREEAVKNLIFIGGCDSTVRRAIASRSDASNYNFYLGSSSPIFLDLDNIERRGGTGENRRTRRNIISRDRYASRCE